MKTLWLWVPWVPYQLLGSLQDPLTCMPLSLQKALQRHLKQGPCLLWRVQGPRGMKTNQATNPPTEKGQEDEMKS